VAACGEVWHHHALCLWPEAVLPSGDIITCGGKLVKNVTGYNMVAAPHRLRGHAGHRHQDHPALNTSATEQIDLLVPYDDLQAAADTVFGYRCPRRIVPTTIEFMERDSMLAVEQLLEREVPFRDAAAQLLIQLDGNRREQVDADMEVVGDLCLKHGARTSWSPATGPPVTGCGGAAQDHRGAQARQPVNHMEDVVVPRSEIPALMKGIHEIAARHRRARAISFGHAGDGNVHVNVLKDDLPLEPLGCPGAGCLGGDLPAHPLPGRKPSPASMHRRHPAQVPAAGAG